VSVLVTGGAGYIGSVIAERLSGERERIVCLDDFSTGHRDATVSGAELVEGSVLDATLVEATLRRYSVDAVVHCAAFSIVEDSVRDPLKYFQNNVVGTHTLLRAMLSCGVRRFVLSSTAAVYGEPTSIPIEESHSIAPLNPYGRSKRMIEEMLEWHARSHGLSYVSLRYFNAAGASARYGEHHLPETHLIPIALEVAAGTRDSLNVFGSDYPTSDGTCVRDFIHVEDLADAHVRAVSYLRQGGLAEVINLGTGTGHSVLEVARAVEQVTGRKVPLRFAGRRAGDVHSLVASREKAAIILGWLPSRSGIEQMVADAWRWRQRYPHGYPR
jgi:UDP-glucose 4-epimerase